MKAQTKTRLESAWLYQGPEATKTLGLSADQVSYAITLRRQLAQGLLYRAPTCPNDIAAALKREIRRCDRAHKRLAKMAVQA